VSPQPNIEKDIRELEEQIAQLRSLANRHELDVSVELRTLEAKLDALRAERQMHLSAVDRVQLARHPKRPYALDYVRYIFHDFFELHGDRAFRDDAAIVGGWARLNGRSLMVIGHQKGRDMKENLRRNFGMPHPEGYRKALRLMLLAAKFGHPIVTLIDTPGAYPGIGAEERGQAEAIARNLLEMARLPVPLISAVIGEGGSGGALALGVADRVIMLENATYSVISPEGCAAILWKTASAKDQAADALKLTAHDLGELGVIDEVVPEPVGGAHVAPEAAAASLAAALARHLAELRGRSAEQLRRERWEKYQHMGAWRTV
jgi:acetyl-CoA carboxylase carboxyl transferase subunit alpha